MSDYWGAISRLVWLLLLVWVSVPISAPSAQPISPVEELPVRKVIVVDPGHGGNDPGAVGPSGLAEKVVTLSIAKKIREILSATHEVHLTRDDDYSVDIERRTEVANHYRANMFISIHAGGASGHQGRGTVIFYHRRRSTGSGSTPYRQHRDSWEIGEKPTPWDDNQAKSQLLAKLVHRHLMGKLSPVDKGVREAPLLVLRGADMSAVLVEIAHLSHPAEEAQLRKPEIISAAAQAISEAIKEYFSKYP
jgi:N-acetylmuramoyl-L-alanine amidase